MSIENVLITGASAGIGEGLARLFAADGARLILVARNATRLHRLAAELQQLHGVEHVVIAHDLAVPGAAKMLFDELLLRHLRVDVLVNNAGFGHNDRFATIPIDEQLAMVQLNIATLVHLTHLILPQMIERREGRILNLGSTASFQPGPFCAVYFATKAFVLSFSEALWDEVREDNISVTCLCPGPTRTEFGARAGMNDNWNFAHASMSTADVCRIGYRGFRRGKRIIIPGLVNRLLTFSVRLSPRRAVLRIMRLWQRPKTLAPAVVVQRSEPVATSPRVTPARENARGVPAGLATSSVEHSAGE
ncbi:MAG: short-chain dehydrogenase [Planctomycetaceae bacterium]|nr:short-chain dehydrogenase [Planctomycetaceae bacterium]